MTTGTPLDREICLMGFLYITAISLEIPVKPVNKPFFGLNNVLLHVFEKGLGIMFVIKK